MYISTCSIFLFLAFLALKHHDCIACYQCLFLHISLLCSYHGSTHFYASSLSSCACTYKDTIHTHRRSHTDART
ncbi:hypothetical protein B0H15DRAFT_871887 [Mycena belliarum]|uniref:Secreted protein n=1 Tax=Mycena belliarum TaxID=1033014 RepID=A0AAD6XKW1_9AGAR|nr:hypothetical protein B0H15DRAFT_871887 [Mycena belliae]